jgi:DNA invertase Pin-like site-specific DNA recombinase
MDFNQARIFYIYIVQDEQTFVCWRQRMRRKITNQTWEQVETAYASGIGLREIARNMNIPEGTVLSRAKREGWTGEIQSAKVRGFFGVTLK